MIKKTSYTPQVFNQWKEPIYNWKIRGLSQKDYCKQKKIAVRFFAIWQKQSYSLNLSHYSPHKSFPLEKRQEIIDDREKSNPSKIIDCSKEADSFFSEKALKINKSRGHHEER